MSVPVDHIEINYKGYTFSRDFDPPLDDDLDIELAYEKLRWDAAHGGVCPDDGDDDCGR